MTDGTQGLGEERRSAKAMMSAQRDGSSMPLSSWSSLAGLLDLSRELRNYLVPVQARSEFREELCDRLLIEACRRQALQILALPAEPPVLEESRTASLRAYLGYSPESRRWIIGAAAVGSAASLVGLLAYVRNRRHGTAA